MSRNSFWHTNGVGPKESIGANKPCIICVVDVRGQSGKTVRCGTELKVGETCSNAHLHIERPVPFSKRVANGDHARRSYHGS